MSQRSKKILRLATQNKGVDHQNQVENDKENSIPVRTNLDSINSSQKNFDKNKLVLPCHERNNVPQKNILNFPKDGTLAAYQKTEKSVDTVLYYSLLNTEDDPCRLYPVNETKKESDKNLLQKKLNNIEQVDEVKKSDEDLSKCVTISNIMPLVVVKPNNDGTSVVSSNSITRKEVNYKKQCTNTKNSVSLEFSSACNSISHMDKKLEDENNPKNINIISHYAFKTDNGKIRNIPHIDTVSIESSSINNFIPIVQMPPKENESVNLFLKNENIIIEEVPYNPYDSTYMYIDKPIKIISEKNYKEEIIESSSTDHVSNSSTDDNTDKMFDIFFEKQNLQDGNNKLPETSGSSNYSVQVLAESIVDFENTDVEEKNKQHENVEEEEEVEKTARKNYTDRRDFCFFCEKDVSHFSRHLFTWHHIEVEVQKILSYDKKSKERRNLLATLKKKGNFVRNRTGVKLRPVKRIDRDKMSNTASDYLPCSHCFGFYKRKGLYRHTKVCIENTDLGKKGVRQSAQSQGQSTLLLGTIMKHDALLTNELFPRMRADEINLVVKKDMLICNYGYSYLKGRRSKGNLDLVRQNMRRLAKLLQFARNKNSEIKELIDLLRPTYFQIIVSGVNKIARYNTETDIYESPTLAINFGTLLKKCCDLAYIHLLQKPNTNEQRKDLKVLKTLIESQWANEVSAQAITNLNTKKWNKEELLPLTSDLKMLNKYLIEVSEEMFNNLIQNENNKLAYNNLKEILFTQIILLNRRRPAEVAQLKVHTYKSIDLECNEVNEFEECLTETEKVLLNSYKRIIIRGKRGRGVPILLSQNMKKYLDCLINLRSAFVTDNEYIFHTSGKNFIDGTKVIYKYAVKCGVQRPKAISATRLRKHLATITQLLNFSEKDLEQLSKFMGHTLNIHCNVYRLSDDMYQTAKVSKLLLLATDGGVEKYKGMKLDDINIDLNPVSEEHELEDFIQIDNNEAKQLQTNIPSNSQFSAVVQGSSSSTKTNKIRQAWTAEQKNTISTYFGEHIKQKRAPKQAEVEVFINEYPEVCENRKWEVIKAVVYNMYTGKLKM